MKEIVLHLKVNYVIDTIERDEMNMELINIHGILLFPINLIQLHKVIKEFPYDKIYKIPRNKSDVVL